MSATPTEDHLKEALQEKRSVCWITGKGRANPGRRLRETGPLKGCIILPCPTLPSAAPPHCRRQRGRSLRQRSGDPAAKTFSRRLAHVCIHIFFLRVSISFILSLRGDALRGSCVRKPHKRHVIAPQNVM